MASKIVRNRLKEIAENNSADPGKFVVSVCDRVTNRKLWRFSLITFWATEKFRQDLLNIARTTLSSKILRTDKDHFAKLCVDAVLRLKGSKNLDAIHIIKKTGGSLAQSRLEDGFILEKKIGVGCPKRIENAKILIANTAMDTDKIKVFSAKVSVDSVAAVAEIEEAERVRRTPSPITQSEVFIYISLLLIRNECGLRLKRLSTMELIVSLTDN